MVMEMLLMIAVLIYPMSHISGRNKTIVTYYIEKFKVTLTLMTEGYRV